MNSISPQLTRAKRFTFFAFFIMMIGSVGLDQVSKVHSQNELMMWSHQEDLSQYTGQRIPLWTLGDGDRSQSKFYIAFATNYVRNLGAAWGALSSLPDSIRVPFFYMVTIIAVIIIGVYMKNTPLGHRLARFALVLILSGAIGNFIDRVVHGYVIDWIDVRWNIGSWRYDFPNFNVADCAITVGVSLLMVDMLILESLRRRHDTKVAKEIAGVGETT
jgi:signal peptidase II